jgi:hypothetical protein
MPCSARTFSSGLASGRGGRRSGEGDAGLGEGDCLTSDRHVADRQRELTLGIAVGLVDDLGQRCDPTDAEDARDGERLGFRSRGRRDGPRGLVVHDLGGGNRRSEAGGLVVRTPAALRAADVDAVLFADMLTTPCSTEASSRAGYSLVTTSGYCGMGTPVAPAARPVELTTASPG